MNYTSVINLIKKYDRVKKSRGNPKKENNKGKPVK